MTVRPVACCLLLCAASPGQWVEPRKTPADYPAHAVLPDTAIAAEYLVRSVSGRSRTFFLNDYLVVEIGVFPARGKQIELSLSHFRLEVGEKKKQQVLSAVGPQFVAASLKYPDWQMRPRLEAAGGVGDAGVIVGRPSSVERFPGDPRPGQSRLPAPPRAPNADHGVEPAEQTPVRAEEVVLESALREGPASTATAGYLYFPHRGKTRDLRPVHLVYDGPAGSIRVRLR